jgi:hypothetical protein
MMSVGRDLQETLQALYDSEINVTIITTLWDGGYEFGLISSMDDAYSDEGDPRWHHVETAANLADGLHEAALREFPESGYAKRHAQTTPPHFLG